nr:RNA-directed DNA polymerase, eukaryota, reverse transcriptase zinc-binding domain protein [Tanacetum cinerariifolium]
MTRHEFQYSLSQQSEIIVRFSFQRNEGFDDLKIHNVGGFWVWFQFNSEASCEAFKANENLKNLWPTFKSVSPSFVVDERLIWLKIYSLPLGMGRVCIVMKRKSLISELVNVVISKASYMVQVQEVGSWNILITDDTESTDSKDDHFDEECKSVNTAEKPLEYLDEILQPLEEEFEPLSSNNNEKSTSDGSVSSGFENVTKASQLFYVPKSSMRSTLFANYRKKDIKGFFIIDDLNRLVEVGGALWDISECYGSLFSSGDATIFNFFIQDANLLDLPMGGKMFTWMNKAGTKLSKIDRFLILEDVLEAHSDIHVTILDKLWSNHNLILLDYNKIDFGPIPFHIFHSWFDCSDLVDVVKELRVGNFFGGDSFRECYGSLFSSGDATIFNSFIQDANLLDLPMGGKMFTWMNKAGTKLSKIDRFLILEDVLEAHSDIHVTILDKLWSNHNLILLDYNKIDFGPIPFHIFHSWFDCSDLVDVVKELSPIEEGTSDGSVPSGFENVTKASQSFYVPKSKCYGSLFSSGDATIFNSFIQDANLLDLPMGGKMFTWMNKAGTKLSKIDRFLILEDVLEAHSDIHVTILDNLWSNHNPILLDCNKIDFGPIPFHIFHSWFDCSDLVDVVKELRKRDITASLCTIEDLIDSGNATDDNRA